MKKLLSLLFVLVSISSFAQLPTMPARQVEGLNGTYITQTNGSVYSTSPKVSVTADTLFSFGDSFSAEYGVSSGEGYNSLFANRYSLKLSNQALSGSGVWQAAKNANDVIFPFSNNDVISVLAGFNDLRRNGAATSTLKKISSCLSSIIANNLIDTFFAADNARVTTSGTWGTNVFNSFGGKAGSIIGGLGRYNNTSGSYTEWTASGQNFIVGFLNNVTSGFSGGEFDLYVDGTLYTHVVADQADGVSDGGNSNELTPGIVFVKGLTNTAHTIRVTNTTNNYVYVDYFATVKLPKNTTPVLIGLIPKMDATGYATSPNLGSNIVFEKGDSTIISTVNQFYGWPVCFVPINDYYKKSIGLSTSDHIHPNKIGQRQIADALSNHVSSIGVDGWQKVTDIGNTTTNTVTANGVTIGKFPTTSNPFISLNRSASSTDNKIWDFITNATTLDGRLLNDGSSSATTWMTLTRSGITPTSLSYYTNVGIGGTPSVPLHIYTSHPSFLIQDNTSGSNGTGGFFSHYYDGSSLDVANFAINRNPSTGTIINSGRTTAQMSIASTANGTSSNFIFYTTPTANGTPAPYVGIHRGLSVGSSYYATDAGDGTGIFESTVGIGVSSPTARLHLHAGTATANTAPLKINSGTLLGTTEAGAIENDGAHLYYTATNGGTRYQLDQQGGGGSTTFAGLTDVSLTSPANNDIAVYNGTAWLNKTPAQIRTILGLSTVATTGAYSDLTGIPSTIMKTDQANTVGAGNKLTVTASSTTAGLNFAGTSADPSSLAEGDIWRNTTGHALKFYDNGTTKTIATTADVIPIGNVSGSIGTTPFHITGNPSNNGTLWATSTGSQNAIWAENSSTGTALTAINTNGGGQPLFLERDGTATNDIQTMMTTWRTGGTIANNFGSQYTNQLETSDGSIQDANSYRWYWTNATTANRTSNTDIYCINNATTVVAMNIQPNGVIRVNNNADTLATKADVRDGIGVYKVSGSDVSNTSTTLATITGLVSGTLAVSTLYEVDILIDANSSSTAGGTYAIVLGGTGTGGFISLHLTATTSTTAATTQQLSTSGTASTAVMTLNGEGTVRICGYVKTNSSGTPTITVQQAKTTSGTIIARIGSRMKIKPA